MAASKNKKSAAYAKVKNGSRKTASKPAAKAAPTYAKIENTRSFEPASTTVGTSQLRDFVNRGTTEARQTQEKILAMGRENAEQMARAFDKTSETMSKTFGEADGMEAAASYGTIAGNASKAMAEEWFNQTNEAFNEQVELSKDFFTCRTLSDVLDVHTRMVRSQLDHFFDSTLKFSELFFRYSSEAAEPMKQQMNQVSARMKNVA